MTVEKRRNARHRVLKGGTIEFGGAAIDCTIRNLSPSGAAIEVENQTGIPDHFTLVVPGDGLHMPCHVAWRRALRLGLTFD
ncbi:PilZ domain-containing protein [Bradyrhizobium jicamae]|nr:PilZ domain-containing protein [Bradyrhizobium jicamae]